MGISVVLVVRGLVVARDRRQMRGERRVGHRGAGMSGVAHGISRATIRSAASSALIAAVSMRISGSSGAS